MKDFDEVRAARPVKDEEERTFRLGGETFTIQPSVSADVLAAGARVDETSKADDDVAAFDEMVLGFLDDTDHERYLQLRRRKADPVTFDDLYNLVRWMVQVNSARPTEQPSSSGSGPTTTPPSLTAVSSPPPAAQAG